MFGRGRLPLGLAVGEDSVTAIGPRGLAAGSVMAHLRPPAEGADLATSFEVALREVAARLGVELRGTSASIVLLPSVSDARMVPLPPLRSAEVDAVIRRDAGRYFLGGNGPRVVGVSRAAGGGRRGRGSEGVQVLAAAAAGSLLETLHRAARTVGLRLTSIVPAHASWASYLAGGGAAGSAVVSVIGETAHVLARGGDGATRLRRVPVVDISEVVKGCGAGPGTVSVFAPADPGQEVAKALGDARWTVATVPGRGPTGVEAAILGIPRTDLELVPPSLVELRDRAAKRTGGRMIAAAAVVLLVASAVNLWGARRALDAVRAERREIAEAVTPLITAQDSLNRLTERIETVEALTNQSPTWTLALVDLALHLPADSYLTGLNASGDTVEIEAAGAGAGDAIEALRSAENLRDVRLVEAIERVLENGETIIERFRLSARLSYPGSGTGPAETSSRAGSLEEMISELGGRGGS